MKYPHFFLIAACAASLQCSPHSGTGDLTRQVSMGYGSVSKSPKVEVEMFGSASSIGSYLIGYLFSEIDEAITDERTGDYPKQKTFLLQGAAGFPGNGYFLIVRTIRDDSDQFSGIAGVSDFISGKEGTPAARLIQEIVRSASAGDDIALDGRALSKTLDSCLDPDQKGDRDKIALLAICPVLRLEGDGFPEHAEPLYAVGLTGMYFPLLWSSRFQIESIDAVRRLAKSRESMTFEIYGPNGSGYSTGIVKLPLVWNPPDRRGGEAPWLSGVELRKHLVSKEDEDALGAALQKKAAERLATRQAFVAPSPRIKDYLHADLNIRETSEATGWLLKASANAKKEATSRVP